MEGTRVTHDGDGADGVGGVVDVVVPLKRLSQAKSRLVAATAGPSETDDAHTGTHRELVLALARDTLAAVRDTARVRRVVLVTAEDVLDLGIAAERVADPGAGLNAALRAGAAHLRAGPDRTRGRPAIAVLQADLPALRADELDDALRVGLDAVRRAPAAFVPDRHGSGTTMLLTAPGREPDPRFGPGSARAHRDGGAVPLDGPWPGLRADVDTPEDLRRAGLLGCGPATSAWTLRVGAGPSRC